MSERELQAGSVAIGRVRRPRGSAPILILAALFLVSTFLAWYFTWFGRDLSDADISNYLSDTRNPRHVQHALLQVQQKIERGDPGARKWYPQVLALSRSSETEFRLTVAWLLGFDTHDSNFHEALTKLLHDPEPIVRRNAALALVRFNDHSGRDELLAILRPYQLKATVDGKVASTLREGDEIARGSLLARIEQPDGRIVEVRSPLPGKIARISKLNGAEVATGDEILSINSDEESIWECLRGLAFVGEAGDLPAVREYQSESNSDRVKQQAQLTSEAILQRTENH